MKYIKLFEELNPIKYKLAADRLDPLYHGDRKKKLEEYFINSIKKSLPPFDLVVKMRNDDFHLIVKNCYISDVKIDYGFDIFVTNGEEDFRFHFGYVNDGEVGILTTQRNDENNFRDCKIRFTSRKNALLFFKFVSKIVEHMNSNKEKHKNRLSVDLNNFYVSSDFLETIKDQEIPEDEERED